MPKITNRLLNATVLQKTFQKKETFSNAKGILQRSPVDLWGGVLSEGILWIGHDQFVGYTAG